jgi:hypothetical protein
MATKKASKSPLPGANKTWGALGKGGDGSPGDKKKVSKNFTTETDAEKEMHPSMPKKSNRDPKSGNFMSKATNEFTAKNT